MRYSGRPCVPSSKSQRSTLATLLEVSRAPSRPGQPHLGFRQRELPAALELGHSAFTDQFPFELGQRREDAEHEAAGRRGGVDRSGWTGEHPQAHAAGGEVLHGVDPMGEAAAETVEFPDHEHVALPQGAEAAVESWPLVA